MPEETLTTPPPETMDQVEPIEPVDPVEQAEQTDQVDPRFHIQVAEVSDAVSAEATDRAEEFINERTNGRGFNGILRKIWYGNIARDYYRQREIRRGRQEITETGNVYSLDDGTQAQHDAAMGDVVERFTLGHLHQGETNESLDTTEPGQQLMEALRILVTDYGNGTLDYDALVEERTRLLDEFGQQAHQQDRQRGLMYADNILEVAANVRAAIEHQTGLDRIDIALTGSLGEARTGVRTETQLTATDRVLDSMHRHHMSGVNEATAGTVVAIGMGVAKFTTRKIVTAATASVTLGLGAGLMAAGREHLHAGQDRQLHLRQRAEGGQIAEDSHRREQMEETRYETVSATELTNNLQTAIESFNPDDPESMQALALAISEADARIQLSDLNSMDLIEYSHKTSVEGERLALDIELDRARVLVDELTAAGQDIPDLEYVRGVVEDSLNADITEKDRLFRQIRRNRALKMGIVAFVAGETLGMASQEIRAGFDHGLQGVFEQPGSGDRHTLLAQLLHLGGSHHPNGSNQHREFYSANFGHHDVAVDMPPGYHITQAIPNGKWELSDSNGNILDKHLFWDSQGNLSKATRHLLTEKGFILNQHHLQFNQSHVVSEHVTRSPGDYIDHHRTDFTRVHRQLWYDNNTPGVYDQNELKLDWGASGTGIDSNGNYVFNVADMLPGGSFHDGLSANAQQLIHDGHMKIALSMTQGSQHEVFMVPVDSHGNAVINANSYIGRSLFETQDGHAKFIGAYAEADQILGTNPDGSENVRMLATVVGDNHARTVTDTIHHVISEKHTHYVTNIETPPNSTPIETPPVLPIYSRRGLEGLQPTEQPGGYYNGYNSYNSYLGPGERPDSRVGTVPFAREVESNPDARIDGNKSTRAYLNSLRPSYKKTLEKLSRELKKQPSSPKPKVVVMIPAAAHQEGKNIYQTLEQYKNQQDLDGNDLEIVVFANNPKGTKPDATIKEIKRFQKENPGVNVRLLQQELERSDATIGRVRKTLTDTVLTDLVERGIDLNEVLLVSNDADSEWIDPEYIRTIIDKAAEQPDVDGFLGFIDWSYDAYKAHPDTLAATRLMQMIEIYLRRNRSEIGSSGANFVFRPGAYTAVGGYNADTALGEDVTLGRMIKTMRRGAETRRPIAFLGRSSEINTSARRALDKLHKDGGAPAAQWDDDFSAYDELRTREFDLREFDFNDPAAVDALVKSTENMLNQTVDRYRESLKDVTVQSYKYGRLNLMNSETMRNMNRMLSIIGVSVKWNPDGSFRIVDASRMLFNLRRWQATH